MHRHRLTLTIDFAIITRHLNLTKDGALDTDDVLAKERESKMVGYQISFPFVIDHHISNMLPSLGQ